MIKTFTLTITAGNVGMETEQQIADALLSVAGEIRNVSPIEGTVASWKDEGTIKDANGNRVGSWRLRR